MLEIVVPIAWLHDFVIFPKNDPKRAQASWLAAQEAGNYLQQVGYPSCDLRDIEHVIEADSFSAQILCQALEAKIVQDASSLWSK